MSDTKPTDRPVSDERAAEMDQLIALDFDAGYTGHWRKAICDLLADRAWCNAELATLEREAETADIAWSVAWDDHCRSRHADARNRGRREP